MKQAYPSEPLPLKRAYPKGMQSFARALMMLSLAVAVFGLAYILSVQPSGEGGWKPARVSACLFTGSLLIASLAMVVRRLENLYWRFAFLANNADLSIDWLAVVKVSYVLGEESEYKSCPTDVRSVAIYVAEAMRARDKENLGIVLSQIHERAYALHNFHATHHKLFM